MENNELPQVHFGEVSEQPVDWKKDLKDSPDDDEQRETDPDVVAMLGFDPAKEKEDVAE